MCTHIISPFELSRLRRDFLDRINKIFFYFYPKLDKPEKKGVK
jgi:hypothetical protein